MKMKLLNAMRTSALLSVLLVPPGAPSVSQEAGGESEKPSEDLIKAILIKEAIRIISANIDASKNENGEIAKLVRALSGVSITDIERYGLCGGENSEVRKLFGSLC